MLQYCPDRWIFKPIQNSYVIRKSCEQRSRENWRNNLLITKHLTCIDIEPVLEEVINLIIMAEILKIYQSRQVILQMDTKNFLHILRKKLQGNFLRSLLAVLWLGAHYPTDYSKVRYSHCHLHQRNG